MTTLITQRFPIEDRRLWCLQGGDVVDEDANPDQGRFPADIEIFGPCLVEDRDHVEPGQPDPLVVIGDSRCELVFFSSLKMPGV